MSKSTWGMPTKGEILILAFGFSAPVLSLVISIHDIPIVREIWKSLLQCKIDDCQNVETVVSIIGSFFVVVTLTITILSLIMNNIKYRKQIHDMDSQHNDQMNLMNGQVQLLIQNNRMANLKEYLMALLINIDLYTDSDIDDGIHITTGRNGVILKWKFFNARKPLNHRLVIRFRLYSPEVENLEDILKDKEWYHNTIYLIRLSEDGYVMPGFSIIDDSYFPIEKVFHDMNCDEYDAFMVMIFILTLSNRDNFKEYRDNLRKYEKSQR